MGLMGCVLVREIKPTVGSGSQNGRAAAVWSEV